ncbi:hypothetical protein ADH72_07210 [Akkermansia muciniphila]|uniref:hypothetical protein n=2 Tax=Akkermansia muciniphila TaxID=239935 RepID=UPI00080C8575|nr:hypothetical protein [Akkermansia muciniphila]ANU62002.1 hypothetical protein A4V05_11480 [Akkermansia muciniphila]ASB35494.1 hypothetical protein ADH72_07210 [Akkermansia muciniphila]QQR32940.1 hypothetical protein I5Q85_09895 [Akkermansia muciniphila]
MRKMTNEQYWLRRDRAEKMESLYGCPIDLPENDLTPRPGIVQNLVFSALLVGIFTIIYFIINAFL